MCPALYLSSSSVTRTALRQKSQEHSWAFLESEIRDENASNELQI